MSDSQSWKANIVRQKYQKFVLRKSGSKNWSMAMPWRSSSRARKTLTSWRCMDFVSPKDELSLGWPWWWMSRQLE